MLYNLKQLNRKLNNAISQNRFITIEYFLDEFMIELYSIEKVENPSEEENEFGNGYDELIISINPKRNIIEDYDRVIIERRIKLFTEENESQLKVEFDYEKIVPLEEFYRTYDFFLESEKWISAINNHPQFEKLKNCVPVKITLDTNVDFIGN